LGTFFLDPTGEIRQNAMIGPCALRPEGPARFCLAWFRRRRISRVIIMNEKVLDRIHKLGPVAITVPAVLALASAWGASQWQLTALSRAQDMIAADQKRMAADIRTIREGMAALQAVTRFNDERITDLRGRMRHLERK
jgi:hypothetical protein